MGELIPVGGEFGIVLAKDNGIVNIGCTATVDRVVQRYPDGRLDVLVAGQRRFRIEDLDEEKSYLRAEVEFFDDEDLSELSPELNAKASEAIRKLRELESASDEPHAESSRLSFQLAQLISDVDKRQTVLALRSEVERIRFLIKVLPEYLAQQEQIALAKRVGPLNGHAKHVVDRS
jgi:ATP-dependent Lon protease